MTALHFAAKHGMSLCLIQTFASKLVNNIIFFIFRLYTGHAAIIDVLVDHGASLDAVSTDGWKPIHYAVAHGHLNAAKALVKRYALSFFQYSYIMVTPFSIF